MRRKRVSVVLLVLSLLSLPATAGSPRSGGKELQQLIDGNNRYVAGKAMHPRQTRKARAEVARGQKPFAVILSCADSRVPPEILFDQGLGDLFVVRIAGNIATPEAIGSIEFAVKKFGAHFIMVLGHERCGAVEAAQQGQAVPGHIGSVVDPIKENLRSLKDSKNLAAAVDLNVEMVVKQLEAAEPVLSEYVKKGEVKIVGARYDLDTGRVSLIQAH
jgi:carbonic anhydrase